MQGVEDLSHVAVPPLPHEFLQSPSRWVHPATGETGLIVASVSPPAAADGFFVDWELPLAAKDERR